MFIYIWNGWSSQIRLGDFLRSFFDFSLLFWEHCHLKCFLKTKLMWQFSAFRVQYSGCYDARQVDLFAKNKEHCDIMQFADLFEYLFVSLNTTRINLMM